MTEQTETERNEAILKLEEISNKCCRSCSYGDGNICPPQSSCTEKTAIRLAITALKSQSEAERRIERITNALGYAEESQDPKRAISIIDRIIDGMTDEEIMAEDNDADDKEFFEWVKKSGESLEGKAE